MILLISVIVPVYNVEPYLKRCVDSILNQTYKDFELILVDDGSTDRSGEICDEYKKSDDRVKIMHKENAGISDARNKGIEEAFKSSSEWITFVDSDDFIHPETFERLLSANVKNGTDLSICEFMSVSSCPPPVRRFNERESHETAFRGVLH